EYVMTGSNMGFTVAGGREQERLEGCGSRAAQLDDAVLPRAESEEARLRAGGALPDDCAVSPLRLGNVRHDGRAIRLSHPHQRACFGDCQGQVFRFDLKTLGRV